MVLVPLVFYLGVQKMSSEKGYGGAVGLDASGNLAFLDSEQEVRFLWCFG